MANWLRVTILPRMGAGVISAMYIGEMIDAEPIPSPPRILKATNVPSVGASAVPSELAKKQMAEATRALFRPILSLTKPALPAPTAHPSKTDEEVHPSSAGVIPKCLLIYPMAPEMTAVS